MKKIVFLSLIISLIIGSCTLQENAKSPHEGTWRVIGWQYIKGDSVLWTLPGTYTGTEMQITSKKHFLWVGRYQRDTTFTDNYGGGIWKMEGNRLEEEIEFSADQSMVGTKIRLLWELKNDTAIQTWPCDENWQVKKDDYMIQKWIRLE